LPAHFILADNMKYFTGKIFLYKTHFFEIQIRFSAPGKRRD